MATWRHETFARVAGAKEDVAEFIRGIGEVARHFGIMATSVVEGVQFLATGAIDALLPIYAVETLQLPGGLIGWLFAAQIVTTLVAKPMVGRFSDRMGRRARARGGRICRPAAIQGLSTWRLVRLSRIP